MDATTVTTDAALCEFLRGQADATLLEKRRKPLRDAAARIEALGREVAALKEEAWTAYRHGFDAGMAAGSAVAALGDPT